MTLREANPVTDHTVDALALDELEADLLTAIVATPQPPSVDSHPPLGWRSTLGGRRGRGLVAVGAAAFAAAFVAVGIGLVGGDRGAAEQAWGAEAVRVANSVPRLLLPGWTVERADEFTVGDGEMTFRRGERTVDLHWSRSRGAREAKLTDRAHGNTRLPNAQVLDAPAAVFLYSGSTDDHTALWTSGGYQLELRGQLPGGEFLELLSSVHAADVDTWLAAMPASVVKPLDTRAVVDEMLRGLPLPPGFDRHATDRRPVDPRPLPARRPRRRRRRLRLAGALGRGRRAGQGGGRAGAAQLARLGDPA